MSEPRKKLIEVALPLTEINDASRAYKNRKVGTIRNLHKWFAAMPLPAWRALLYASLIDDPQDAERRLYHLDLIKRLVAAGADLPDEDTLAEARGNLIAQFPDGLPTIADPFCGGGSTLVEAQRLGLRSFASDLNPVPVLITRILTEVLPRVVGGMALPHPEAESAQKSTSGSEVQGSLLGAIQQPEGSDHFSGLHQDTLHYANWVLSHVLDRLGSCYYTVPGHVNVAWLWACTVSCPSPACRIETIITSSWWLSKRPGNLAWIEPSVEDGQVLLTVVCDRTTGEAPPSPKTGRGAFACVACGGAIGDKYLRNEGTSGRLGTRLVAIVSESESGRHYRAPERQDFEALELVPAVEPLDVPLVGWATKNTPLYGLDTWDKAYLPRQIATLTFLAGAIAGVYERVRADGGSEDWAMAISSLLGLSLGKAAQANSRYVRWNTAVTGSPKAEPAFGQNDLPMLWDFVETNPFGGSVGSFLGIVRDQFRSLKYVVPGAGEAVRADARSVELPEGPVLVATDPPYFDAIGYADLSDYFYLWHRQALRRVHPDLYSTVAAPKAGELTAIASHHGNSKVRARDYFIDGFTETFRNLQRPNQSPSLPMLVVYASREKKGGVGDETRWSSILSAMIRADLEITGTWPIHGTTAARLIGNEANAVATYVVMVARPRPKGAQTASVQEFNRALRRDLKKAVVELQGVGVLPVDLAQAAMGPGMQVYSRYRSVFDQAGEAIPVEVALRLINQALGEVLDEQEGDLDPSSRFAVTWWDKHHWDVGPFGLADQLARPHGMTVDDVVRSGVAEFARPGYVRVVGLDSLSRDWRPSSDTMPTAWEAVHHLADRLIDGGGVAEAGDLMASLGELRDQAQALVYRMHAIAAQRGWTKDQERYNALIGSWSDLLAEAGRSHASGDGLF